MDFNSYEEYYQNSFNLALEWIKMDIINKKKNNIDFENKEDFNKLFNVFFESNALEGLLLPVYNNLNGYSRYLFNIKNMQYEDKKDIKNRLYAKRIIFKNINKLTLLFSEIIAFFMVFNQFFLIPTQKECFKEVKKDPFFMEKKYFRCLIKVILCSVFASFLLNKKKFGKNLELCFIFLTRKSKDWLNFSLICGWILYNLYGKSTFDNLQEVFLYFCFYK